MGSVSVVVIVVVVVAGSVVVVVVVVGSVSVATVVVVVAGSVSVVVRCCGCSCWSTLCQGGGAPSWRLSFTTTMVVNSTALLPLSSSAVTLTPASGSQGVAGVFVGGGVVGGGEVG